MGSSRMSMTPLYRAIAYLCVAGVIAAACVEVVLVVRDVLESLR